MTPAVPSNLELQRAAYVSALGDAVSRIVTRLTAKPAVRLVVLFGSYAHGRRDLFTDLDMLVVMESEDDFLTRTGRLYQELEPAVDMDLFVYTPTEFEQVRERPFVRRALETGTVLLAR